MHATSAYIAREQFICHQTVERTQAHSKDFHTCVVRALLQTRVFMKFKSSCTVAFSHALFSQTHPLIDRSVAPFRTAGRCLPNWITKD